MIENYHGNHGWRGILFSKLIKQLNYTSYLELGVSHGNNCWYLVNCEKKVGVDLSLHTNIEGVVYKTTDEYFNELNENTNFDLIYIDACHEKYQVYKDFCNSIKHLNDNGIIVFHDILPLTEDYTCINTLNGNVYELWIELSEKYPERTSTFIGYPGDPEGTIGIYFGHEYDEKSIDKFNYSYSYFFEKINKYIYHKTVNELEIIDKIRNIVI